MDFVHLHVHTEYSLLKSVCRINELVAEAKKQRFSALAITDENVLYGVIPFYKQCINAKIKPILGMELHLIEEHGGQLKVSEVILLAKNEQGYENLLKLSTEANMEKFRVPGVEKETLFRHSEGLVLIFNFATSDVSERILSGRKEEAGRLLWQYRQHFENIFFELQAHDSEELKQLSLIDAFAKEHGVPTVATNHVHFLKPKHHVAYKIVQAVRKGEPLEQLAEKTKHYYFKSEGEMRQIFRSYEEALLNTKKIADLCDVKIKFGQRLLPKYPVPQGETSDSFLRKLCEEGAKKKYGTVDEKVRERLEYELSVISKMKFSDYFLIVWDFMKFAHEQNIMTGPGRGSAAGSIVSYVLNITNVDPLRYELLFERFLNPERMTMPDIDIDFCDHRREEVIDYVVKKYGQDHVAQIITFGTFAAKAAIRDVGRVLKIDGDIVDQFSKLIPSAPNMTLDEALKENKPLREFVTSVPEAKNLLRLAKMIEGLPRHTSTHAAGVVISEEPLTRFSPLKAGQTNIYHTQFPMEVLEEIGLLKMDFLGLRNLTLIEEIVHNIVKYENPNFQIGDIKENDKKTYELLSKGETTGIFQLESEGMRRVLAKLKPTEFEDIVAVNSLYRPGPSEFIPLYIDRKHGKRKITYPHPSLEPILKNTYGVIVYQEQIMQIASKMAGFTLGEADLLRRAVSKKNKDIIEKERVHFVSGAIKNGYTEEEANFVYDMIAKFANYGFNRSHAVAYSMISYTLAYLKANFPLAFYAALFSTVIFHQEKLQQYIAEARRMRIQILPPSINSSICSFAIENGAIRFGLMPLRYVGERAAEEIVQKRKAGPYRDLFNFCRRVNLKIVTKRAIESLILSGCFDELNDNRAALLATLDEAMTAGETWQTKGQPLFDDQDEAVRYAEVMPFNENEKLTFEKEVIGFYLSAHPIETYAGVLNSYGRIKSIDLEKYVHKTVFIAGMIEKVKTIETKKGDPMAFITISDEYGDIEAVVFPEPYRLYLKILKEGELVFCLAKIERRNEERSVVIQKMKRMEEVKLKANNRKVFLRINNEHDYALLEQVKNILLSHPGKDEVYLHFPLQKKTLRLSEKYCIDGSGASIMHLKKILGDENIAVKE